MGKMYTGSGRMFQEVQAIPMDGEGLVDMKRRVKVQPQFLGEPLVVVAEAEDFPGVTRPGDGLMVAIDTVGSLAAVTIATGVADVELLPAAMQLAAHLATLENDEIARLARRFIGRPANEQLRQQWESMDVEMAEDAVELPSLLAAAFQRDAEDFGRIVNSSQRIIIAAEDFSPRMAGVIQWLGELGVNIVGLRYHKYMVAGQEVFSAEQAAPKTGPATGGPTPGKPKPESLAPWRVKGRQYQAERLGPALTGVMDSLLEAVKKATVSLTWSHKYSFWIRGSRRSLRVRTYARDRLEIGFHNAAPAAVVEFLQPYGLAGLEVVSVGGYSDSPFVALGADASLDQSWIALLNDWLTGATPGKTAVRREEAAGTGGAES